MNGHIRTLCSTEDRRPKFEYMKHETLTITGLRPHQLFWNNEEAYPPIEDVIARDARELYYKGYRKFVVCCRPGIEQLAVHAIRDMKIRRELSDIVVSMYVPYNGFEYQLPAEGIFGQVYYWGLLDIADEIEVAKRVITPVDTETQKHIAVNHCIEHAMHDSSLLLVYSEKRKEDPYINNMISTAKPNGVNVERRSFTK